MLVYRKYCRKDEFAYAAWELLIKMAVFERDENEAHRLAEENAQIELQDASASVTRLANEPLRETRITLRGRDPSRPLFAPNSGHFPSWHGGCDGAPECALMILCCLTLACSAPPDGTTPAATDDDAAAPITAEADASAAATLDAAPAKKCGTKVDVDAPMFLFYGLYDNVGDDPATLELAPTANGEPTVTMNRGAKTDSLNLPEFDAWKKRGGKIARTVDRLPQTLDPWFSAGTAKKWFIDQLTSGFDYVTIDELKDATEWRDGQSRSKGFVQLLDDLAAAGFDRRVALYVNAYNLAGSLHLYQNALRACRDHCRVIALEIYVTVSDVFLAQRNSPGHCEQSTACFEFDRRRARVGRAGIRRTRDHDPRHGRTRGTRAARAPTARDPAEATARSTTSTRRSTRAS